LHQALFDSLIYAGAPENSHWGTSVQMRRLWEIIQGQKRSRGTFENSLHGAKSCLCVLR